MLTLISPAKTLDFSSDELPVRTTSPQMLADTHELMDTARTLSSGDLQKLMGVSKSLGDLNRDRFQSFVAGRGKAPESRAAALAFRGDTYIGLQADDFDADDLSFAQEHLRILSGLYGLLRPLDRIQPYRLEMGVRLATGRGENLYSFWGERIAQAINRQAKKSGAAAIVNLASKEYFTAASERLLKVDVITPAFKELRDGQPKIISFAAKRARGMMARHIIKHRLTDPRGMLDFEQDGYRFNRKLSTDTQWVFLRKSA
jgi:cytoplasmic iron level regulating protein YaaA (DUF328/UPF0246 family)